MDLTGQAFILSIGRGNDGRRTTEERGAALFLFSPALTPVSAFLDMLFHEYYHEPLRNGGKTSRPTCIIRQDGTAMANRSNRNYILFDHTADLGLEVYGNDEKELFCNAAFALFDILCDTGTVAIRVRRDMAVEGADREDLLVNFLRELLYLCNGEGLLLKEFVMLRFGDHRLEGRVGGEQYDPDRHRLHQEIKAVTYHQVRVEKRDGGWKGRVIFDV